MSSPQTHSSNKISFLLPRQFRPRRFFVFILSLVSLLPFLVLALPPSKSSVEPSHESFAPARLSDTVAVQALGRGNPIINLENGRELITSYSGPDELRAAFEKNEAEPLTLAMADFDEDGVPDLVSGYALEGRGAFSVVRGNVDSIHPNAPAAVQRRASGNSTAAPFLSPARLFGISVPSDFIGAGDFDADGHWDLVCAARFGQSLVWFAGDGLGSFSAAKQISLPGLVTAVTVGEANRRDGLNDVVVGVTSSEGSQLLVFEGPNGALNSQPESFAMPAAVSALALGQLDQEHSIDVAVAAGNELIVLAGRDRKLSLDPSQQATVSQGVRRQRIFKSKIESMVLGNFADDQSTDIALLLGNELQILNQPSKSKTPIEKWPIVSSSFNAASATRLFAVGALTGESDNLIAVNPSHDQLQLFGVSNNPTQASALMTSLDVVGSPVAVLPAQLNTDALSDLIVVNSGKSSPVVLPSAQQATFVVTNTNASGAGSLQFAILDANETPGADLITFNIPGSGPHTIFPTSSLPTITDPVTIDATTQPGYAGDPVIVLHGDQAGIGARGFTVAAGPSTIKGFRIKGWKANGGQSPPGGDAISITGGNSHLIVSNVLGVNDAFNQSGVHVTGGHNHIIGGTVSAARNVIAWETFGVILSGGTTGCLVQGNFIGTDVTGTQVAGSGSNTAVLIGSFWGPAPGTANMIGGTTAGARNIIAGGFTVDYVNSAGEGNLIQGNYIGTNVTGTNKLVSSFGSGVRGVSINAAGNTVGGTTPAARNVIVAGSQGVRVFFGNLMIPNVADVVVHGNYIGTKSDGTGNLGHSEQGVVVNTVGLVVRIGGAASGAGNVISNSGKSGVEIVDDCVSPCMNPATGGHTVQGNYIGTDASGTADLGNTQNGVYLRNTRNNVVGGLVTGTRNVISGNGLSGVFMESAGATGNVVQGNYIGTNATGTAGVGNDLNGVTTSEAPNNTIGGDTVESRNIISANGRHGVSIGIDTTSGSTGITVKNNYIGTDLTGNACLGNQRDGVFVNRGSVSHTIVDNVITCNGRNGVNIPNFITNDPGIRINVTDNSIFANAILGIDLGDAGITANDPGDPDGGANFQQNFPVLMSSAQIAPEDAREKNLAPDALTINGTLNSTPNATFTVHWYFSADSQCTTNQAASRPLAFGKVPNLTTDANGNAPFTFPFDFPAGANGGLINCTATDSQGNTSEFSACFAVGTAAPPTPTPTPTPAPTPSIQFQTATYNANEAIGSSAVTITRTGNTGVASSVRYETSDSAGTSNCGVRFSGVANSRCDYATTVGTLHFAQGEASKTILIPIVNDSYSEAGENLTITLSDAVGAVLASPTVATFTIFDDENPAGHGPNPIGQASFFVRLHYIDFFTREPDSGGLAFWSNQITECGTNAGCIDIRRTNVSAAFYVSIEFQETGFLVYRFYKASYGNIPGAPVPVRLGEFLPDTQQIGRDVIVGQGTGRRSWKQIKRVSQQTSSVACDSLQLIRFR